ncbi:hypothetical protein [Actinomadura chokoriensis]|uniref:hypothetical protein n=1 Tax=Actinomadura chokoriensis TaxID=454156 RepID=UPI0031F923E7
MDADSTASRPKHYFHVQLMYDTGEDVRYLRSRGLRRAHLARDLAVHRRSRQRGRETAFEAATETSNGR